MILIFLGTAMLNVYYDYEIIELQKGLNVKNIIQLTNIKLQLQVSAQDFTVILLCEFVS